jgi:hypothetical protein
MVAEPCRRLSAVARWNGHAPQTTTGVASASATHSQPAKCSAEIIDMTTTGSPSSTEPTSRRRSPATCACSASTASASSGMPLTATSAP